MVELPVRRISAKNIDQEQQEINSLIGKIQGFSFKILFMMISLSLNLKQFQPKVQVSFKVVSTTQFFSNAKIGFVILVPEINLR